MSKISYAKLKKILSPKEMKQVLGGSNENYICSCEIGKGTWCCYNASSPGSCGGDANCGSDNWDCVPTATC